MGKTGKKRKRAGPEGKKMIPKTEKKVKLPSKKVKDEVSQKKRKLKSDMREAVAQKKAEIQQQTLQEVDVKEENIKKKRKIKKAEGEKAEKKSKILSRGDRKDMLKERRAAKPHAELVARANEWWALPTGGKKDKRPEIDKMLEECKTKMVLLANKHDTSRVLQRMIKNGTPKQRHLLFEELKGKVAELVSEHYGHFVILKFLEYGTHKMKLTVMEELKTNFTKLMLHKEAATVIDFLFASGNKKAQNSILREFYGKEFILFGEQDTLATIVEANPEKLPAILENINKYIMRASDKEMLHYRPFHSLLRRFFEHAPDDKKDAVLGVISKSPLALHHSADGAWVLNECIGLGNAKSRKKVVKALKGQIADLCQHKTGFLTIAKSLCVVDDTSLLQKGILGEVIAALPSLVSDPHGCKVLLNVLRPAHRGYVTEREALLLQPHLRNGEPTSKKDALVQRREILQVLLPHLVEQCAQQAKTMLSNKMACRILLETVVETDAFITEDVSEEVKAKWPSLLEAFDKVISEPIDINLFQHACGHWCLKNLLKLVKGNQLAEHLSNSLLTTKLGAETAGAAIAKTNRGAFVLTALLEKLDDKPTRQKWSKALKATSAQISSTAGGGVLTTLLGL